MTHIAKRVNLDSEVGKNLYQHKHINPTRGSELREDKSVQPPTPNQTLYCLPPLQCSNCFCNQLFGYVNKNVKYVKPHVTSPQLTLTRLSLSTTIMETTLVKLTLLILFATITSSFSAEDIKVWIFLFQTLSEYE